MTLGELIENLQTIRDGVLGVGNSTPVQVTDDAYTAQVVGLRLVSEPTVSYGMVSVDTTIQVLVEEV